MAGPLVVMALLTRSSRRTGAAAKHLVIDYSTSCPSICASTFTPTLIIHSIFLSIMID